MDCIYGPIWTLHSLDWAHRVGNTASGILQGVACGVTENTGLNAQVYHTDEKWQGGQSYEKSANEHWSLFNEHWKIARTNGEITYDSQTRFGGFNNKITSESQLTVSHSHSTEQCKRTLKRDPIVYSNPFDPVLMFNGILSDVIDRDSHVMSETGNCTRNNSNSSVDGGGDSSAEPGFNDRSTHDVATTVGMFERHVTHYHNHVLRMRDSAAMTPSSTDAPQSVSCPQCDQEVPVDLRGAGDDVVRMARAVFSDRVRLLWSDEASVLPASSCSSNGGGEAGRWPSPGPARRPLHVPWRLRHFLAYSRRHAARDVTLDGILVQFKEMRREELSSKSTRFVTSDAAVRAKNTIEAHPVAAAKSSSACLPATRPQGSSKVGRRVETCLERDSEWGVDRDTAADDDDRVRETGGSARRLCHSFSDSDLHRVEQTTGWSERWTKLASMPVKMPGHCTGRGMASLVSKLSELSVDKDWSAIKSGSLYTANASAAGNFQPCLTANILRMPIPSSTSAIIQLPVCSQEVASSSSTASAATKLSGQRAGAESSSLGADISRQVKSGGQARNGKPPLVPIKDRRRTTASSVITLSPKKTSTSTSDKVDCGEWSAAAAGVRTTAARRHQQAKQHQKKKTDSSSSSSSSSLYGVDGSQTLVSAASGTAAPQLAFRSSQCALRPPNTTTAAVSAPIFTAVPAGGVLLHGALPVTARRCLQPVDARHRHQQQVLVAEQSAVPCSRLYRPGPSTAGHAGGNPAGWGYPASAPAQPAVCHEYLLLGPSSVLLLR